MHVLKDIFTIIAEVIEHVPMVARCSLNDSTANGCSARRGLSVAAVHDPIGVVCFPPRRERESHFDVTCIFCMENH
jgi:hypothetical protein